MIHVSNSSNDIEGKIRKALEPYLSNLDIISDDAGGFTIVPHGIEFQDTRWYAINEPIKKLDGSWVKPTKFTRGYWQILKTLQV